MMRALPHSISIIYVSGSTNQLADCLSRHGPPEDQIKLPIVWVHEIAHKLQTTVSNIEMPHEAAA